MPEPLCPRGSEWWRWDLQVRPPFSALGAEPGLPLLEEPALGAGRALYLVQPPVEGMPAALGQVRRRHPHCVLALVVAVRAHRHGAAV